MDTEARIREQTEQLEALEGKDYTATRHRREVGAGYFDRVLQAVAKDSSTLRGSTEEQQFV